MESRVDVETGNEEEESLEEVIPTFEVIQKNPTCGAERELEDCGVSVHRNWRGTCVKDRCARKPLQVEQLEKETEPPLESFDCVFLTQENADTTLKCENEPSPKVFQEAKIFSCVEATVRITDDIPLLNWIPHFAMRFLNKMRIGRRGKNVSCAIWRRGADIICETHNSRSVCPSS